MKEVAIIGAGQLGSRHLQGVLKSNRPFNVTVVDPVEASLHLAKQRASEVSHTHSIRFASTVQALPHELDLVIVATNANVRLKVLEEIVGHAKVNTMLLEKVLFQRLADYTIAKKLLDSNGVTCFVNHARRIQGVYQDLKDIMENYLDEKFTIQAYGANWGLGCNGLHLSDLFSYLLQDRVASYSGNLLDSMVIESKRPGFKEFTGWLHGAIERGHSFSIGSIATQDGIPTPISISLYSPSIRISISEVNPILINILDVKSSKEVELSKQYSMLFQSELSKHVVEDILDTSTTSLTSFDDAMHNHLLFIACLNNHLEQITGKKPEICPIT